MEFLRQTPGCGYDAAGLTRRTALRLSAMTLGAAALQLNAAPVLAASPGRDGFGRAQRMLLVFLSGGPSHIDLWDPKPGAPAEIRGPFAAIPTAIPGVRVTELLPNLARELKRATLVRSCSYSPVGVFDHAAATYEVLTGIPPADVSPSGGLGEAALRTMPTIGRRAIDAHPDLTGRVVVVEGGKGGLSAFSVGLDDANATAVPISCRALDLSSEPARVRSAYGANPFGASLLAARRMLEDGARIAQVNWPSSFSDGTDFSLDGHFANFERLRKRTGPALDLGLSALLADLDARGLLQETLVLAIGEFGRAPRLGVSTSGNDNGFDGRDHWPYCFTALVAGAGVARGAVYGESDEIGAYPKQDPVAPSRLVATAYHALGLESRLPASEHTLSISARPLSGLFS